MNLMTSFIVSLFIPTGSLAAYLIRQAITFIASAFIGVFQVGVTLYFLKLACGQPMALQDIIYGFKSNPEKSLVLSLIMTAIAYVFQLSSDIPLEMYLNTADVKYLFTGFPIMLVVMVVYVYVSLLVSQVYYLLLDFPNYSVKELFSKSLQLMKGNMWRLFHYTFYKSFICCFWTFCVNCCHAVIMTRPHKRPNSRCRRIWGKEHPFPSQSALRSGIPENRDKPETYRTGRSSPPCSVRKPRRFPR